MDEFPIAVPKRSPLGTRGHLIVRKDRAHIVDRILENSGGRELIEVGAVEGKLKRANYRVGIWRHFTFE